MEDSLNGYRRFLEVQVESLQDQLHALERDPDQVEHLKAILRVCQRLRHAQDPGEPEAVRLLRNALEKVTLHLGRANLAVTRDVLDFYVDTFDLLEQAVQRWPDGLSFDRARYADRVRALLETTEPPRLAAHVAGMRQAGAPSSGVLAGEPVALEVAEGIELTEAESTWPVGGAPVGVGEAPGGMPVGVEAALEDVPTWSTTGAEPRIEVLRAGDLSAEERGQFAQADLRDLLAEPWLGSPRRVEAASEPLGAGGLAASFSTYEALRAEGGLDEMGFPGAAVSAAPAAVSGEAREALDRLRDVLDAFSLSLTDLEVASERILEEATQGLDQRTFGALLDRLEAEKEKLLSGFDRAIESLRTGRV